MPTFLGSAGVAWRRVQRIKASVEIVDHCFNVFRSSWEIRSLIIAAGFVMKSSDDEVSIDGLTATGSILKQSFCFTEVD